MKKLITASAFLFVLLTTAFGQTPCNVYTIEGPPYFCHGTNVVMMGAYDNGPGISTSWSVTGSGSYVGFVSETGGPNGPHKEWVKFTGTATGARPSPMDITFTVTNSASGCTDSFTKRVYVLPSYLSYCQ